MDELRRALETERLSLTIGSNGRGFGCFSHGLAYDKAVLVTRGSISYGLPEQGRSREAAAGDRAERAAEVLRAARVDGKGVPGLQAPR